MKFIDPRPFANPEVAARKLIELANASEPVQDSLWCFTDRISIIWSDQW